MAGRPVRSDERRLHSGLLFEQWNWQNWEQDDAPVVNNKTFWMHINLCVYLRRQYTCIWKENSSKNTHETLKFGKGEVKGDWKMESFRELLFFKNL